MHLLALYVSLYPTLLTFCSCNISNLGCHLHWKTALDKCVEYCQTDNTAHCDDVWCMLQQTSRSMNCYKAGKQPDVSPKGLSNFMLPNLLPVLFDYTYVIFDWRFHFFYYYFWSYLITSSTWLCCTWLHPPYFWLEVLFFGSMYIFLPLWV